MIELLQKGAWEFTEASKAHTNYPILIILIIVIIGASAYLWVSINDWRKQRKNKLQHRLDWLFSWTPRQNSKGQEIYDNDEQPDTRVIRFWEGD
jgi:hypothetical protein